jgi:hypothetical protein
MKMVFASYETLGFDYTTFPFLHFGILYAYPPNFYWISKYW